mgnify:CR=1 FL=1
MSNSVKERVVKIIAEQALMEPSEVSLEHTLEDQSIDSMALVEAIFAIEEEFDIQVPFNANEANASDFDITSVSSIISAVEKLVGEQTG